MLQTNLESDSWLCLTASTRINSSLNLSENEDTDDLEENDCGATIKPQNRPISNGNCRRMEKLIIKTNKQKIKRKSLDKTSIKEILRNESGLESDNSTVNDYLKEISTFQQSANALENLQQQIFQGILKFLTIFSIFII